MEDISVEHSTCNTEEAIQINTCTSRFKLGKVCSKYLIFEMLLFGLEANDAIHLLHASCKNLRSLLVKNPSIISHMADLTREVSMSLKGDNYLLIEK